MYNNLSFSALAWGFLAGAAGQIGVRSHETTFRPFRFLIAVAKDE